MEKIKVSIDPRTNTILEKDAEDFEFFKTDGITLNKNALLTNIIINYHEDFSKKQQTMLDFLNKTIAKETFLQKDEVEHLSGELARTLNKLDFHEKGEKLTCTLNIKPTAASEPIINYIESCLLHGSALSEYFRNLFVSYSKLPQDRRELIVFRPQSLALLQAIKSHKKVFLTVKNKTRTKFEASPYKLQSSREELHHYLLSSAGGEICPLRLSRIISVKVLVDESSFSDEEVSIFEKMVKFGPQYKYDPQEEEVKIRLTKTGIEKFRRMYVHRPTPDKIEGGCYFFNCSHSQIVQYFVRFGKEAFVEYPESVQSQILQFHAQAKRVYLNKISPREHGSSIKFSKSAKSHSSQIPKNKAKTNKVKITTIKS